MMPLHSVYTKFGEETMYVHDYDPIFWIYTIPNRQSSNNMYTYEQNTFPSLSWRQNIMTVHGCLVRFIIWLMFGNVF